MSLLLHVDALLRSPEPNLDGRRVDLRLGQLLLLLCTFGLLYGAVMGTFSGLDPDRMHQIVYSAVKVPLLLVMTFALALPSFFVINSLMGLRDDFGQAVGALIATQAALTIVLASLAPVTALWYASSDDYHQAILFNAVMFATASVAAQLLLRRLYQPLVERNGRHRLMLRAWLLVYAFVGIEMGWILRPFIGKPDGPVEFFREEAVGNAYEVVLRMIWGVISGS